MSQNTATTEQSHRLRSTLQRARRVLVPFLAVYVLAIVGTAVSFALTTSDPKNILVDGMPIIFGGYMGAYYGWLPAGLVTAYILFRERE